MKAPSFFHGLNDIDAATAKRRFHTHHLRPGEVFLNEGDPGVGLGVLLSGELVVEVGGNEVGRIGSGGMFGEMGLFEDGRRSATVRAAEASELWLLPRTRFEELRDTVHPICIAMEMGILTTQVERLVVQGARVAHLGLGAPASIPSSGFFAALARLFGSGAITQARGDVGAALRASHLFQDAPEPVIEALASGFTTLDCRTGALLCREGEPGDSMYLIESGQVEVVVRSGDVPHRVSTLQPGSAFGMVSLAAGHARMASCVASTGVRVHRLDRVGWDALSHEPYMIGSTFRRAVIRAFAAQLDQSNTQLSTHASSVV